MSVWVQASVKQVGSELQSVHPACHLPGFCHAVSSWVDVVVEQTLPVLKVLGLNPSAKTQKGVLGFKITFDMFPSGVIFKNIILLLRLKLHLEL